MQLTPEACRAGRALLGWSMRDLARAARISLGTVLSLERGDAVAKSATVEKIRETFGAQGVELVVQKTRSGAVLDHAKRAGPHGRP